MPVYLNYTDDADVSASVLRRGGKFRPTASVIAYSIVDGVACALLVRHSKGGPFTLAQGEIRQGETVNHSVRRILFGEVRIRVGSRNPHVSCTSYFKYAMHKDRRPVGFTSGKAMFFASIALPNIDPPQFLLEGDNPIVETKWCHNLAEIRRSIQDIQREDKRSAYEAAIIETMHRALGVLPSDLKVA